MSDYNDGILSEPCLRMDTHFGDEYESVEFGDGTGYIKAAPILAKVGALHEEIDRLRDESAFLHECIALNARDANAENDKLRELVRDVFTLHWHGLDCTECPKLFHDRCTHLGGCEWLGILSDRMRELGVEV